ncbi:MAG: Dabb family protein, partial [Gammaproteobacteria bacterium]
MIKHIVLWKLKEQSKHENALKAKEQLEALNGKIPGLIKLEIGIDLIGTENSADIILYSEFESVAALDGYMKHPEHVKLIPFMKSIRLQRYIIDYN